MSICHVVNRVARELNAEKLHQVPGCCWVVYGTFLSLQEQEGTGANTNIYGGPRPTFR